MEKKVIIAVVLSMLVVIMWQKFIVEKYTVPQGNAAINNTALVTNDKGLTPPALSNNKSMVAENTSEKRQVFETDKIIVILSNIGGCIKQIELKEYEGDSERGFYVLTIAGEPGQGIGSLRSNSLNLNNDTAEYQLNSYAKTLEYSTVLPEKIKITKRYNFTNPNFITFETEFENLGSQISTFDYDVTGALNIESKGAIGARYIQADAKVNDVLYRDKNAHRRGIFLHPGEVKWSTLRNQYFMILLKPEEATKASFVEEVSGKKLATGIRMSDISLTPGSQIKRNFLLYAGPEDERHIASLGAGLNDVIYYGTFGGISKVLLSSARFFYKFTKSWGVSIIILAVIMNILLYPLTIKSVTSMHKMQALQPEIRDLQAKHKNNPQQLNKEMMELYKKKKINPFGGCLPMLLQLPIFVALYQGLMRFIELKNERFLWIKDLSQPDFIFGNPNIHILPILMAGLMFVQQRLTQPKNQAGMTEQQAQQQKMMLVMMPLLFGFIFYNFPSGLVLYWFTNTIFMTLGQFLIMKKSA